MWDWIVVIVVYVLAWGLFVYLGGFGAAGEAFQSWGRANAMRRMRRGSRRRQCPGAGRHGAGL